MRLIYKVDAGEALVFSKKTVLEFYDFVIALYYEKKGKYVPGKERFTEFNDGHGNAKQ
jgi:outer membrane protein assembly factor BamD (BamD/ComL family)